MPSETPLALTASATSSVMSRTDSPPLVRSCVSRWKTFTSLTLLDSETARGAGRSYSEGSGATRHARGVCLVAVAPVAGLVRGRAAGAGAGAAAAADGEGALHPLRPMAVDR